MSEKPKTVGEGLTAWAKDVVTTDPDHSCARSQLLLYVLGLSIGTLTRLKRELGAGEFDVAFATLDEHKAALLSAVEALQVYGPADEPVSKP